MAQRLNKAIAARGFCGRRKADELIFAGKVKVNGEIAANPALRVESGAVIEIDGRIIGAEHPPLYVIMNKPVQTVCTRSDPEGRSTVMDFLPSDLRQKGLFPVGRLDYFSEGLLLFTNDGDLALRLAHPRFEHSKVYEVIIRGQPPSSALAQIRKGMILEDGTRLLPVPIKTKTIPSGKTLLTLELRQGVNRQIRRMCSQLNLTILRLRRISEGVLHLGDLKPGHIRVLDAGEAHKLRKAAGLE